MTSRGRPSPAPRKRAEAARPGSPGDGPPPPRASGQNCCSPRCAPRRPPSSATRRERARSTPATGWRTWASTPWPPSSCGTSSRRRPGWHSRPRCCSTSPTPRAVAVELAQRYARDGGVRDAAPGAPATRAGDAPDTEDTPDSLSMLFRNACHRGRAWDGMALLTVAARLRPVFDVAEAARAALEPVTLTPGGAGAPLICFPSLSALSGPPRVRATRRRAAGSASGVAVRTRASRRARRCRPRWTPWSPPMSPRFAPSRGGRGRAARRSAGGWVAQAVAERLAADGSAPAALVLVDTYPHDADQAGSRSPR